MGGSGRQTGRKTGPGNRGSPRGRWTAWRQENRFLVPHSHQARAPHSGRIPHGRKTHPPEWAKGTRSRVPGDEAGCTRQFRPGHWPTSHLIRPRIFDRGKAFERIELEAEAAGVSRRCTNLIEECFSDVPSSLRSIRYSSGNIAGPACRHQRCHPMSVKVTPAYWPTYSRPGHSDPCSALRRFPAADLCKLGENETAVQCR